MRMIIPSTAFIILFAYIFSGIVALASSTDDCYQFYGPDSWNEEFVSSLCADDLQTDKSMSATLCDAYAGNEDFEISLKLAILNTMYGSEQITSTCGHYCMYDPLHIDGADAIGFRWSGIGGCWNVQVGATSQLCYINSINEWQYAVEKTLNWCSSSDPSEGPMCSMEDDCHQFVGLGSWNESVAVPLCDDFLGNVDYENSFKLAIMNSMWGDEFRDSFSGEDLCIFDPLNFGGDDIIRFTRSSAESDQENLCWNVVVGVSDPAWPDALCLDVEGSQYKWAAQKTENWCCAFSPTPAPTTTPAPTACNAHVEWSQDRADELCPGNAHHAYGVGLCDTYDNPDYRMRLEFALANELYTSCSHSCLYDYEMINTVGPYAFFWKGSYYNVQLGKWSCIDDEVSSLEHAESHAGTLCEPTVSCRERIEWTLEADEINCPNGYSGKDKGYGTAKVCPKPVRMRDGYYEKADDLYQASFNRSLANHAFWSCSAKCVYDVENQGVVYQWKGEGCWEMQTSWACIDIHTQEYAWADVYVNGYPGPPWYWSKEWAFGHSVVSGKLCPIATPAPVWSPCVEFVHVWDEATALQTCAYDDMGMTDKSSNAVMCTGFEDYQARLGRALANRAFMSCDAWCVYDAYTGWGSLAYIWRNNDQCYEAVTSGLCIGGNPAHRTHIRSYVEYTLCDVCTPYFPWSQLRADEICRNQIWAPGKSYGSQVCDGTIATQKKLDDSLSNKFFFDCSRWCVYDYETLINNIKTGSSDNGAFLWKDDDSCWRWVTSGICFDTAADFNVVWNHAAATCAAVE